VVKLLPPALNDIGAVIVLELPADLWNPGADFRCPACGRTYSGEKFTAAINWFQHCSMASACLAMALVYQIDRDTEYAEKAAEIIRKYAEAHPGPSPEAVVDRMLQQSIDESSWIISLAQAYDLIYHSKALRNGDRDLIESRLFRPVANGLAAIESRGNWACWHLAAVGVVGCALRDADLVHSALQRFESQLSNELSDDGTWPESVHAYHFFPLAAFVHLAEACNRAGIDLYAYKPKRGKSLKSMFDSPVSYAYPSFQLPAINDGWYHSVLPLDLYEIAHRRWGDEVSAWVLQTGYKFGQRPVNEMQINERLRFTRSSLYAFLFGRDLPGRVQKPRLGSTVYPGLGICVLRSDADTFLTFDYGPFLTHGQRDKMGITLYANNRLLVADYGTPGHSSSVFPYYTGTPSHNTVVVDGKSQGRTNDSNLLEFRTGNYLQIATAATDEAYPGVRHVRQVVMAGDVVVVQDTLSSESEHVYDWLLRCEGDLDDIPAQCPPAEALCDHFTDATEVGCGSDFTVRWCNEDAGLAAFFALDAPGTLMTALCPAETASRMVPVVDLRCRATSARYLSILAPFCGDKPTIERDGRAHRITCGGSMDWVYTSDGTGDGQDGSGEFQTDAEIAAVHEVDGRIIACGLWNGSYIRLRGEMILGGSGQFERIQARLDSRNPVIDFEGGPGGYLKIRCNSRAMRVNGHRISATTLEGLASIRLVGVLAKGH
jgi:hypothetical protein